MADTTENLELTLPELDDYVDVDILNDNWEKLDSQAVQYEVDGSRLKIKGSGFLSGGSSHKYSTEEQVVGEWINGKPIYEKLVIVYKNGVLQDGITHSGSDYNIGLTDVDEWIDFRMCNVRTSDSNSYISFNSDDVCKLVPRADGHVWIAGSTYNTWVMCQYTKISDEATTE